MKPPAFKGKGPGLKKGSSFIKNAIKRPGALTALVGGKPSDNPGKVAALAKKGGKAGQEARFYQNVLKK